MRFNVDLIGTRIWKHEWEKMDLKNRITVMHVGKIGPRVISSMLCLLGGLVAATSMTSVLPSAF